MNQEREQAEEEHEYAKDDQDHGSKGQITWAIQHRTFQVFQRRRRDGMCSCIFGTFFVRHSVGMDGIFPFPSFSRLPE